MPKPQTDCSSSKGVENFKTEDLDIPDRKASRHPKSLKDRSFREKEIKVVRTVCKELSSKAFQSQLNQFHPSNGLLNRRIVCKADQVSIKFSSPLNGISYPSYIKKFKVDDMIGPDGDSSNTSSVIAVGLNWRKGVKVEQVSQYSRQTKLVEPALTRTEFDFESKLKFTKQLQYEIATLFPNQGDVRVLDGNECHGRVTIKSQDIQPEGSGPSWDATTTPTNSMVDIYDDKEEHKILLIPFHSKSGFDTDISKRYSFPYRAKFTIDKQNYEHSFQLRLIPAQSPQHFGLIFTFPLAPAQGFITIKSLLSVHSVFPSTPKHAVLVTYTKNEADKIESGIKKGYKGQFVKNLKETVSVNLEREKLVNGSAFNDYDRTNEFSIGTSIAHPHQRFLGIQSKPYWERLETKQRQKASLALRIKSENQDHLPDCADLYNNNFKN